MGILEGFTRLCAVTRKPQLFLICCFFSLLIGGISSLYFYYPESVSSHNGQHQHHPFHEHHISTADEADLIEQEQRLIDSKIISDSVSVAEAELEQSQRSSSNFSGSTDQPSQGQNLSSSHIIILKTKNSKDENDQHDKVQIHSSPELLNINMNTSGKEETTKIRHHHISESQIIFMKLNDLVEKSKFTNLIERRLIHFDLKGAPPKVTYFKEIIKLSQEAGLTGLLIEWEDTFPWRDNLRNLTRTENFYTLRQVEDIIHYAEMHGLEVIPLVQTFGHVEFILKQEEFSHLREVQEDPQAFCPSKTETMDLIHEMIWQTVQVHRNSRFVHIGCDEVFNLRVCNLCTLASESKDSLFIQHVTNVATYVRTLGKIPIIWDDMLRTIPRTKLSESNLGSLVEPMVWIYAEDIDRFVGWEIWEKYVNIFPTIWVAGAFKGAFGETLSIPKLSRHAENTQRWIDIVARQSQRWEKGIGGMVLTGWSRYDHFAVLCELLPASIPSLIYSSLITSIPSPGASIRNRIFVVAKNGTKISRGNGNDTNFSASATITLRKRRSVRRWVPHPQSLRIKERSEGGSIASFARTGRVGGLIKSTVETGINDNPFEQRQERIATDFLRILNCPVTLAMTKTILTAKNSEDDEFSFVSRCNFPGVSFFRSAFRLRSLLMDVWDLITSLNRGRGWLTKYNRLHQYSLPLRVDELVFKDIPRLKRNLVMTAKSIGISMRTLYSKDTILEWLEQNVWDAWEELEKLEKAGYELKRNKIWSRRPLESPEKMTVDLGLKVLYLEKEEL